MISSIFEVEEQQNNKKIYQKKTDRMLGFMG